MYRMPTLSMIQQQKEKSLTYFPLCKFSLNSSIRLSLQRVMVIPLDWDYHHTSMHGYRKYLSCINFISLFPWLKIFKHK